MPLDRRRFLAASASLVAASAIGTARGATVPHRFTHGAFEISVVSDGYLALPTAALAGDAPPEARAAALKAAHQTGEQYQSPTNCTLIRAGRELILIDAGSGAHFMPSAGKLTQNLETAGIAREMITQLVFTHGHPDHLWGLVDDLDDIAFPNARYLVGTTEWDFWHGPNAERGLPSERAGFVTGARRSFARIKDKVTMVKAGDEIAPGIRVFDTRGHTQGHFSLEIAGGDGLIVGGDALTHPVVSFAYPDWRPAGDHEPDVAIATRRKLLDRLATDKTRLIGFHLPFPGTGIVERKDGAYRFVAA
jgi:glyoxylase-like metal-dependent hydrolase (beta-lactamase superfamily II)